MADLIESGSDAQASYNFEDLEDGFNYITYYLHADTQTPAGGNSETVSYNIGKDNGITGDPIVVAMGPADASPSVYTGDVETLDAFTDVVFSSSTFKLSKVADGTALIDFSYSCRVPVDVQTRMYPILKLYHYDGSTETQLGSTWYGPYIQTSSTAVKVGRTTAKITFSRTKFKSGDSFRLKVGAAYGAINTTNTLGNSTAPFTFGIDPLNRDDDVNGALGINPSSDDPITTTVFKIRMPFRVSI